MTDAYSSVAHSVEGVSVVRLEGPQSAIAEVAPEFGFTCFSFRCPDPVLEQVAFGDFKSKPTSYGIPILFPFPNRIRDGRFEVDGHVLTVDPPRHGFVRDKAWQVVAHGASDADGAWVSGRIEANDFPDRILNQFPFPFRVDATWRLRASVLSLEISFQNTGDRPFPFGFGIHPYFEGAPQATVMVPAAGRWELEDSLPTGQILDLDGSFDLRTPKRTASLQLDDIYTRPVADSDRMVRCVLTDPDANRQTVVEFDSADFQHIVVFTPPAPRTSICVEPNTCPTDGFNLQARGVEANVLVLEPGASKEYRINIRRESVGSGQG